MATLTSSCQIEPQVCCCIPLVLWHLSPVVAAAAAAAVAAAVVVAAAAIVAVAVVVAAAVAVAAAAVAVAAAVVVDAAAAAVAVVERRLLILCHCHPLTAVMHCLLSCSILSAVSDFVCSGLTLHTQATRLQLNALSSTLLLLPVLRNLSVS